MNKVLTINFDNCTGCQSCVLACSMENEGVFDPTRSRIRIRRDETKCMAVPALCERCDEQFCVAACPEGAIRKDSTLGIMVVDPETCISCGTCIDVCPWGGIRLHPDTQIAMICDLCGGTPACADICIPMNAIQYTEANSSVLSDQREFATRRSAMLASLDK